MTKNNVVEIRSNDVELVIKWMTIITIAFMVISTIIVLNIDISMSNIEYVSIDIERIPVEEQFRRYIDSLPIPKAEYPRAEYLETNQEMKEESKNNTSGELKTQTSNAQAKKITTEYVEPRNLIKEVENITPIITNLNTSAYCSCEDCCEKTDGITASGKHATTWHTVAAGKGYPIGTIIYIPTLADKPNGGWFVVEDRGGAISNEKLDIFFNTHEEALQYGRKTLEAYVYMSTTN